jgi:hypothetical protein
MDSKPQLKDMKLDIGQTTEEFEKDLTRKAVKAVIHLQVVLSDCYYKFWDRPTQEILDSINSNIPETMKRFNGNTAIGMAVNERLEAVDWEDRVPITMPEGYAFDGAAFTYTAPATPEPEPPAEEP